jgi:hypothetical protein
MTSSQWQVEEALAQPAACRQSLSLSLEQIRLRFLCLNPLQTDEHM